MEVRITPWADPSAPTEEGLRQRMERDGLRPYLWSSGPHDRYPAHSHEYDKVIHVVTGTIVFGLPDEGRNVALKAGDRLELPAYTVHDAEVGADGVVCLEAHSQRG